MMTALRRSHLVKWFVLVAWIVLIVGTYVFLHTHGIRLRAIPQLVRREAFELGPLGSLFVIGLYGARTPLLLPTSGLDIAAGAVYGPWIGSLIALVGLNFASVVGFGLGRWFGHFFAHESERGWVKKYQAILMKNQFLSVLSMRLFLFPIDVVSIGCGLTKMSFRPYFFGSLLGSIPITVTFVVLGHSFFEPKSLLLFGALLVLSVGLALILRRSRWANQHLLKKTEASIYDDL